MPQSPLLISTGTLTRQSLAGRLAIVTGAGGGIGFEAARSLAWLGARVVIAEINPSAGQQAARRIAAEFGPHAARFVHTDVGDERSVARLARQVQAADIVINNATLAPLGGVTECSIRDWDASYRVNLRGPVLLARAFLPGMVARGSGVFVCVSSAGGAYMGAYEALKTAQVELARTLDAELEGSRAVPGMGEAPGTGEAPGMGEAPGTGEAPLGVIAFTISPGIVPTETMMAGVARIAPHYGLSPEQFYAQYREQWISVEAAGAGFAAAVALAEQFRGMEVHSRSGLNAAGIVLPEDGDQPAGAALSDADRAEALALCRELQRVLAGEYEGWKKRPLFERQWMLRDFRQYAGQPVEEALAGMAGLQAAMEGGQPGPCATVAQVRQYFQHYQALARGALRDPAKAAEYCALIQGWEDTAARLSALLEG
ncbi:MAG: SDR family oxidoreductase [Anaerolineaceae bacterium]|nr:SDR family oxidoreductase [Anaerolineaceae bacterium]